MQSDMPKDISMTAQTYQDEEPLHAGSKRRSPPTVQSDDDGYPPSPTGDKIVQTTKAKTRIKSWLRQEQIGDESISLGQEMLAKGLEIAESTIVCSRDILINGDAPTPLVNLETSCSFSRKKFSGFCLQNQQTRPRNENVFPIHDDVYWLKFLTN